MKKNKKIPDESSTNNKSTKNKLNRIGSRLEVMHGKCLQTAGGLKKEDLKLNKNGHIVSIKASDAAKNSKNLINAGYLTTKGRFGWVRGGKTSKTNNVQPNNHQ